MGCATGSHSDGLSITASYPEDNCVLRVAGVLDRLTYRRLRDHIIKEALEEPAAVLIDITSLSVPAPSALAVFTSARWHIGQWPDVPMALVREGLQGRETLRRNGVTRYLPVYPELRAAITAVHEEGFQRPRRRARADIPRSDTSVQQARALTVSWLTDWDLSDYVTNVSIAVTVLVENAVAHTEGVFALRLEAAEMGVTVAVEDSSGVAAMRGESVDQPTVSGLDILNAVCRIWGNLPTPTGKVVWAAVGPENQFA